MKATLTKEDRERMLALDDRNRIYSSERMACVLRESTGSPLPWGTNGLPLYISELSKKAISATGVRR